VNGCVVNGSKPLKSPADVAGETVGFADIDDNGVVVCVVLKGSSDLNGSL
jgi:hypothetical protein